ncbi:hypothetical protein [Micromonospora sp. SL4-19]|uniref:MmyB family transcriptional regulator n=1 Tax=Micromonospora sp. SL4-19 TaxID=3399129 RepID=UPI003A4DB2EF
MLLAFAVKMPDERAHPGVGDLSLGFEAMPLPADPGLTLTAYHAEPGTAARTPSACSRVGRRPRRRRTASRRRQGVTCPAEAAPWSSMSPVAWHTRPHGDGGASPGSSIGGRHGDRMGG